MTECNRCGDCCEVIAIAATVPELRLMAGDPTQSECTHEDATFVLAHWQPLDDREAYRLNPVRAAIAAGNGETLYTCDQWNPETRLCEAHDTRPPVCRNFPWYGEEPAAGRLVSFRRCSFWADIPFHSRPRWVEPVPASVC